MFKSTADRIEVPESVAEINRIFHEKGWTDGLPIVPPTPEAVSLMLQGMNRKPDEVIGLIPPRRGEATVEKLAVNAVMAGCLPEHMPIIVTAMEAMLDERFNLYGVQATTHPCGPLLIINGPVRHTLGINCGNNVFGPGNLANAAIGRAVRLILLNVGGGIPGKTDKSTQGNPGKYTFCMGENEEQNPWEPLHVEKGFAPTESTVTVVAAESPHNINDHSSTGAKSLLKTVGGTMRTQGNNNVIYQVGEVLVVFGPEHAATIARDGMSKKDVKSFLWEKARIPCEEFSREHRAQRFRGFAKEDQVPVAQKAEDIMIVVAGGPGKHSAFIPTFGDTLSVTKAIDKKGGEP